MAVNVKGGGGEQMGVEEHGGGWAEEEYKIEGERERRKRELKWRGRVNSNVNLISIFFAFFLLIFECLDLLWVWELPM